MASQHSFITLRSVLVLLLAILASPLQAQWTRLAQFDGLVRYVGFLSDVGAPEVGFLGLEDGRIFRSTDRGSNWTLCLSGFPNTYGLNNIAFKNRDTGWAVLGNPSQHENLLFTTDGGKSWQLLLNSAGYHDLYYSKPKNRLFRLGYLPNDPPGYSDDDGKTWAPIPGQYTLGFAMNSFGDAVITQMGHVGGFFEYSIDAGKTWDNSTTKACECWAPLAIEHTHTFFAVTDTDNSYLTGIFRSDDAGRNFQFLGNWPAALSSPQGTIKGNLCHLYLQTMDDLMVSTDEGISWASIGGPGNRFDTRFYVEGDEVFAGSRKGGLWYFNRRFSPHPGLDTVLDERERVLGKYNECDTARILLSLSSRLKCDSIRVVALEIQGPANWRILSTPSLPSTVEPYEVDSIWLEVVPGGPSIQLGNLEGTFKLGQDSQRFKIPLKLEFDTNHVLAFASDTLQLYLCDTAKGRFSILNSSCDSLFIDSISFSSVERSESFRAELGSSHQITFTFNTIQLWPQSIGLQALPVVVHARKKINGQAVNMSESILVNVHEGLPIFSLSSSELNFPPVPVCEGDSMRLVVANDGCGPLDVNQVKVLGSQPFSFTGLTKTLSPGDRDTIVVRFNPSAVGDWSDSLVVQTNSVRHAIQLSGRATPNKGLIQAAQTVEFGGLYACEDHDTVLYISNAGCNTIRILSVSSNNTDFDVQAITPINVPPNTSITIRVRSIADTIGHPTALSGSITVTSTVDTAIIAVRRGVTYASKLRVQLGDPITAPDGELVHMPITLTGSVPSVLGKLSFDLTHNNDLLSFEKLSGAGLTITSTTGNESQVQSFVLSPVSDTGVIGELTFRMFLAKSSTTPLSISSPHFDATGLSVPPDCIANVDATGSGFTYLYECGDHAIQMYMQGNLTLLGSVNPNPASNELQLVLTAPASLTLFSTLGTQVAHQQASAGNTRVDISSLAEGLYYLRATAGSHVETRQVVVRR